MGDAGGGIVPRLKAMRILLIYPYFLDERLHAEDVGVLPIGLYYIGALLKDHGYDVEILNWHDINKRPHDIEKTLKDKRPAAIEAIPEKEKVAERLYSRALSYFPDHRAYLGLGIIKQKERKYDESIAVLSEARKYYPGSEQIAICLGVSYMNIGRFDDALKCFRKFPFSQMAQTYATACHQAIGDHERESSILKRLDT